MDLYGDLSGSASRPNAYSGLLKKRRHASYGRSNRTLADAAPRGLGKRPGRQIVTVRGFALSICSVLKCCRDRRAPCSVSLQERNGEWLMTHDHVSMPFYTETSKAVSELEG